MATKRGKKKQVKKKAAPPSDDADIKPLLLNFGLRVASGNFVLYQRVKLKRGENAGQMSWDFRGYYGSFGGLAQGVLRMAGMDAVADDGDFIDLQRIATLIEETRDELHSVLRAESLRIGAPE